MARGRERALHATMVVLAVVSACAAAAVLVLSPAPARVLDAPLLGVPLGVVLLAACPATAWLCRRTLELAGLGGAVQVAPDSAVLAFLLWGGAGAVVRTDDGLDGASLLCVCTLAWLVWLAGVCWSETASRGRRGWVRGFNVGLSAVAGAAFLATAVGVRALLTPAGPGASAGLGPADAAAVVAAAAAYVVVDLLLSAVSVSLGEEGGLLESLADESTVLAVVSVVVLAALAVLGAAMALGQPWGLLLLAPVALATAHASQVGARASADRARSSALYRAAERCQRAASTREVLDAVVQGAGEVAAAPASLSLVPPGDGQVGAELLDAEPSGPSGHRWLVCGPRGAGHAFGPQDELAVATLARLGAESLARVAGVLAVRELAAHDPLTGLANRSTFGERLRQEVARAPGEPAAVVFCDVDAFKAVNDQHGHLCGDAVLVAVARRLAASAREGDLVARLGGDEFALVLPGTGLEQARAVADRLLLAMAQPVVAAGRALEVRVSVGVGATDDLPPGDGAAPARSLEEALLDAADRAMYADKRAARAEGVMSPR